MASDGRRDRQKHPAIRSQRKQREDVARRKREAASLTFRPDLEIPPHGTSGSEERSPANRRTGATRPKRSSTRRVNSRKKRAAGLGRNTQRRKTKRRTGPQKPVRRVSSGAKISRTRQLRQRRIRITVTTGILLVGILLGLIVFLPQFYLQEIEVRGLRLLNANEVVREAGLTRDNHLLSYVSGNAGQVLTFRYGDTETLLTERMALIKEVTIRPKLPYRAVITVDESTPLAFLDNGNVFALPDQNGKIIATTTTKPTEAPLIQGVGTRQYEVGDRMISDDVDRLEEAVRLTDTLLSLDSEVNDGHSLLSAVNTIRMQEDGLDLIYIAMPRGWLHSEDVEEDEEDTILGIESDDTILLLLRIDRGAAGADDLRWFRDASISGRLRELGTAAQLEEGALAFPGTLDLSGSQRSYRPDMEWP